MFALTKVCTNERSYLAIAYCISKCLVVYSIEHNVVIIIKFPVMSSMVRLIIIIFVMLLYSSTQVLLMLVDCARYNIYVHKVPTILN